KSSKSSLAVTGIQRAFEFGESTEKISSSIELHIIIMLARKIRLIVHAHRWSHDVTYRHNLRSPELIRTEDGSIERNSRRSTMVYEESFCDSSINLPFYIVPCSPEFLCDPHLRVRNVRRHHNRSTEDGWQRQCNGQIMLSSPLQCIDQTLELKCRVVK